MITRVPSSMGVMIFPWDDIKYYGLLLNLTHGRHSASSVPWEWAHIRSSKKFLNESYTIWPCLDTKWKTDKPPSYPMGGLSPVYILILFHEKSTLSPLSLPPRIPQPGVSPGFILLFLPPRLGISAMGFFLSPVEGALSYVAEGNLNNSILFRFFEGVGRQFLKINHWLTGNSTTLLVFTQKK